MEEDFNNWKAKKLVKNEQDSSPKKVDSINVKHVKNAQGIDDMPDFPKLVIQLQED